MKSILVVSVLLCFVFVVKSLDNGLGLTPAMGYNTWNDFRCDGITADNIKKVADKMVELNLVHFGYEYLNIDDCWAVTRDANGVVVANQTAFPEGIKAIADYVHSKGLKFGIYTDRGTQTCAGRPGSQGYEEIDAQTYASWGVDYLKEDSCYATGDHDQAFAQYGKMRDALNATGRPIYFSLCGWNSWYAPVGYTLGNSWRIGGDVNEWESAWNSIEINVNLTSFAKPGGWNDPDMLVGSHPGSAVYLSPEQSRTQFSLWSVMAAPLLIGANMLNMSDYDLETYTNQEVIAIDQDPLGVQGSIIWHNCPFASLLSEVNVTITNHPIVAPTTEKYSSKDIPPCQQIWAKKLSGNDYAVALVNYANSSATVVCDAKCLSTIGITRAFARDLWAHKDLGVVSPFSFEIPANGTSLLLRIHQASSNENNGVLSALTPISA